jgi:hypothetical protein
MSYAVWADFVYYEAGDIVGYTGLLFRALQPNINVLPTTGAPDWELYGGGSGIYTEAVGGSSTTTIAAPSCVPSSVVMITYIHTGGGGGAQYIKGITAGTGSFVVTTNTPVDLGDEMNWMVVNV